MLNSTLPESADKGRLNHLQKQMKLCPTQETFEKSGLAIRKSDGFNRLVLTAEDEEFVITIDEQVVPNLNDQQFNLSQGRASKNLKIIPPQKCGDNSILLIGSIQAEHGHSLKVYNPYSFDGELLYKKTIPTSHSGWLLYIIAVIRPQNNLILEEHLVINNHPPEYKIYTNNGGELTKYQITQEEYRALLKEQDQKWGCRII